MKKNPSVTWTPTDVRALDLRGLRAAVVGGTGGIGRAVALALVAQGARVTVVGRTFRDEGVAGLEFVQADLSLLREARRVADALPAEALDLLVFTAGIVPTSTREETAEGLERDMAVSYLNRLVMLRALAPRLGTERAPARAGHAPRVFVMGFPGAGQAGTLGDLNAEASYSVMKVHMNTVAGNEMLVLDGARRHPNLRFFGLNPGLIRTEIRDNLLGKGSLTSRLVESLIGMFTPSAEAYAARLVPLLVSPDLEAHSGAIFDQKVRAVAATPALADRAHVEAFLAASEALVARVMG